MIFTLKKLIVAIRALSVTDFRQIAAVVSARCTSCEEDVVVRDRASSVCRCPHCHSGIFAKWGKCRQGLQRFRCKACGTTFNGFTGTRFAYMKKREKLLAHARCMVEGFSIRRTAKVLGIHGSVALTKSRRIFLRIIEVAVALDAITLPVHKIDRRKTVHHFQQWSSDLYGSCASVQCRPEHCVRRGRI